MLNSIKIVLFFSKMNLLVFCGFMVMVVDKLMNNYVSFNFLGLYFSLYKMYFFFLYIFYMILGMGIFFKFISYYFVGSTFGLGYSVSFLMLNMSVCFLFFK